MDASGSRRVARSAGFGGGCVTAPRVEPEQPENPYCPRCHRATMFATNDDGEFVSVCCAASPQPVESPND